MDLFYRLQFSGCFRIYPIPSIISTCSVNDFSHTRELWLAHLKNENSNANYFLKTRAGCAGSWYLSRLLSSGSGCLNTYLVTFYQLNLVYWDLLAGSGQVGSILALLYLIYIFISPIFLSPGSEEEHLCMDMLSISDPYRFGIIFY